MAEYFSHDYDARTDERIIDLMVSLDWKGYGLYWGIVELLYQNDGTMQLHYGRIAYALPGSDIEDVKSVIQNFDLFVLNGQNFWSESVNKRLEAREVKSAKARESANKRWQKQKGNANAMRTQSDGNAKKESKVKESIESKEKKESKNSARDFYSEQFIIAKGKEKYNAYCHFAGIIFNEKYTNAIDEPVQHIIRIPKQVSYEQFENLAAEARKRQVKIMDLLDVMINKPSYLKGTKSLYLTLLNWVKREPIKGTNH